jgi:hypothetical protein
MIEKLLTREKVSRIEERFIEPFIITILKKENGLDILGLQNSRRLKNIAQQIRDSITDSENPKAISSNQYLKYCILASFQIKIPHEKYLYNQLLHAPNPKYLFPFRKKGTFNDLSNEILLKSNKIDMVGVLYWSYFNYEEGDLY